MAMETGGTSDKTPSERVLRNIFGLRIKAHKFLFALLISFISLTPLFLKISVAPKSFRLTVEDSFSPLTLPVCHENWESNAAFRCDDSEKRMFDVIIVSSGGVGSSALFASMSKEVSSKLNSAGDADALKHRLFHITSKRLGDMVQQNATLSCATRIFVYTFSNAAASVFSLYRRNFHTHHNSKLHDNPFPQRCFPSNTSTYANEGIDYLNLEAHFHSWLHGGMCSSKIPVVFLRSEARDIPSVWEHLRSLIQNPNEQIGSVFSALNISESHYATDEKTRAAYIKMQKIYQRLQEELDSLGYLSVAFKGIVRRLI